MATSQEQYDQAKLRLENNLKRSQLLNDEIKQKEIENAEAIKIVAEIQNLKIEAQSLIQHHLQFLFQLLSNKPLQQHRIKILVFF